MDVSSRLHDWQFHNFILTSLLLRNTAGASIYMPALTLKERSGLFRKLTQNEH